MHLRLYLLLFLSALNFIGCHSQANKGDSCTDDAFSLNALKNGDTEKTSINKDYRIDFLDVLSKSNYKEAYTILANNTKLENLEDDGLFLISNDDNLNKDVYYTVYRLLEYQNELEKRSLLVILLKAYTIDTANKSNTILCLNQLTEIEFSYLAFFSKYDSLGKMEQLHKFHKYLEAYPESLRVKYLWARLNYYNNFFNVALPVYDDLLKKKYYETPILESLFDYYIDRDIDSLKYYSNILNDKFPSKPNLGNLFLLAAEGNNYAFFEEYKRCLSTQKSSDSIKTTIALGRLYLVKKEFKKIDSLYDIYQRRINKPIQYDLKTWETGEYYDLILQSLFLQKKYLLMYKFSIKDIGYNQKIKIDNEKDFYDLVKKYFIKFYLSDINNFDSFYNKNFYWLSHFSNNTKN